MGLFTLPPDLHSILPPPVTYPERREKYETHPQIGHDLILGVNASYQEVALTVLDHHEDATGAGYPRNLSRSAIYPLARNLILIDAFSETWLGLSELQRQQPGSTLEVLRKVQKLPTQASSVVGLEILLTSTTLADARQRIRMQESKR